MSKIKIFLTEVDSIAPKVGQQKSNIDQIKSMVSSVRNGLDSKILYRKNINGQFSTIQRDLKNVERDLSNLKTFITKAVDEYEEAEKKICRAADQVGKPKKESLISKFINKEFIKDSLLILGGLKGNIFSKVIKKGDLKFEIIRDRNGKVSIRVISHTISAGNSHEYNTLRQKLATELGQNATEFNRKYLERVVSHTGMPLYAGRVFKNKLGFKKYENRAILDNLNKFTNGSTNFFEDFPGLTKTPLRNAKAVFKSGLTQTKEAFKGIVDDFNWKGSLTNGEKFLKGSGALGTAISLYDNFKIFTDDEHNGKTGAQKTARFVTNTAIDLAAGAGAAAAGATVGSFFLPPLGTMIGAGVGIGASAIFNAKLFKDDKGDSQSVVDFTKDQAEKVIESIEKSKFVKGIKNTFSKKVSKLIW